MIWIETWTGKRIHPLDPKPEDICIEDIAQGLSNKTRYSGQCEFYSVAEHCVLLADWCTEHGINAIIAINVLLHDASEAYLPDVATPIKGLFPNFKKYEDRMLCVIFQALGIKKVESGIYLKFLKNLDRSILLNEREAIMPNHPDAVRWASDELEPLPEMSIGKLPPERAKEHFLEKFNILKRGL